MSSGETITCYLKERYSTKVFVPFAVFLFASGTAAIGGSPTISIGLQGIALAYVLVLFFRVWDDLADLKSDRVTHPERVMVRANGTSVFRWLMAALTASGLALIASRPAATEALALFSALVGLLGIWYAVRGRIDASALVSSHVVLLKYPAIALIAAGPPMRTVPTRVPTMFLLALVYIALCLYELLHDRTIRMARGGTLTMTVELMLLAVLLYGTLSARGLLP